MSTLWDEHVETLKTRRDEYRELLLQWRFLQGVRIALLVGLVTALAALLGAFRLFSAAISETNRADIDRVILLALPVLAMTAVYVGLIFERVIERMLEGVVRRGNLLEISMNIRRGIFQDAFLSVTAANPGITIGRVLRALLYSSYALWGILELAAVLIAFGQLSK